MTETSEQVAQPTTTGNKNPDAQIPSATIKKPDIPITTEQQAISSLAEKRRAAKAENKANEDTSTTIIKTDIIESNTISEPIVEVKNESQVDDDPKKASKEKIKQSLGIKKHDIVNVEPVKQQIQLPKEIEEELMILRGIAKKPWVELGLAGEREGRSIEDVIESTRKVNGVDPDRATPEDLFKIKLARLGITDNDEVEKELLSFGEKTKSDQLESVMNIRSLLKSERDDMRKGIIQSTESANNTMQSTIAEATKGYSAEVKEHINKKVLGVVLTPEMAKQMETITVWAQNGQQISTPNELFELNYYHKFKDIIIPTIIDDAFAAGAEFVDGKGMTTKNDRTGLQTPNVPINNEGLTPEKRIKSINKALENLNKG